MIRDPSDGSVREAPKSDLKISRTKPDTGVRQPTKTDAMERLEFSREWLKAYHARKETAHARGNDDEARYSTDGRSSNDQGQAQSAVSGGNGADPGAHREG